MNKLRRVTGQISFPQNAGDSSGFTRGDLPGNMMGYPSKSEPKTSHSKGDSMPGNMMGYPDSKSPDGYPPISDQSKNYGPKRLPNPTGVETQKVLPQQMKNWSGVDSNKSEWTRIQPAKKKGQFYG